MIQNDYLRHSIRSTFDTIATGTYDTRDVKSLIVDLRDLAPKTSLLREIGDFLAHPTAKDRGVIHSRVKLTTAQFRAFVEMNNDNSNTKSVPIEVKEPFKAEVIVDEILQYLVNHEIVSHRDKIIDGYLYVREELELHIVSLLQGAVFSLGDISAKASLISGGTVHLVAKISEIEMGGPRHVFYGFPVISTKYPWRAYSKSLTQEDQRTPYFRVQRNQIDGKLDLIQVEKRTS